MRCTTASPGRGWCSIRVAEPAAAPALRAAAWILPALLAAAGVPWVWSEELGALDGDSSIYLLMARHLAAWLPADPLTSEFAAQSAFPPLYPALLALTGGAASVPIAHLVTLGCLIAALALLRSWLVVLGVHALPALAATVLFALMPGTVIGALLVHSEPLYLALSIAALLALARAPGQPRQLMLATTLVALALLARSAGVALVPALAVVAWRHGLRACAACVAIALAPSLLWSATHQPDVSYGSILLRWLDAGPAAAAAQLAAQAGMLATGFARNIGGEPLDLPLAVLALPALVVAALRLRRAEPDAVYLGSYLAMLLLWPYPTHAQRFAWVALPVLLGYLLQAAEWAAARAPQPGVVRAALPAALALLIAPALADATARWRAPEARAQPALRHWPEWYQSPRGRALDEAMSRIELAQAMEQLGVQVPADDCAYSIFPVLLAWYAHRDGNVPPPAGLPDRLVDTWLRRFHCRYVFAAPATSPAFPEPFYPVRRLGTRLTLVAQTRSTRPAGGITGLLLRID
ncbi:MAG TPA: hypothetical protein VM369_11040 [Candidatus Binatia bacterium]|nr:hypothetical protein [Candidatus Binatia bacterium]